MLMFKKLLFAVSINLKINLLAFIIIINTCCERNMSLRSLSSRSDMRIENYTSVNYQNGKVVWKIRAKESYYYFDEKRSIAKQIVMNYYQDSKRVALIEADKAIIHTDSNDIELIGNVDIHSTSGNRLLTSKIRWNNQNKLLNTEEQVKIFRKNGDVIEGIGLRANYDLEDYEIKRKVIAITRRSDKNHRRDKQR